MLKNSPLWKVIMWLCNHAEIVGEAIETQGNNLPKTTL